MVLRTLSIPELFYLLLFCSAEAMEEGEVKEMLLGLPPRATFWHWVKKNGGAPLARLPGPRQGFHGPFVPPESKRIVRLVPRIHKEHLKLNEKETSTPT